MSADTPDMPPHSAPSSGAQEMVGYDIDLTDPTGAVRVSLGIEPRHCNRNGTLHGGLHAMMLDAAAGFAASRSLSAGGELVPVQTLSLTTNYVASSADGVVTVTGRVTGGGFKIIYANALMKDDTGRVLSSASGVFKRVTT